MSNCQTEPSVCREFQIGMAGGGGAHTEFKQTNTNLCLSVNLILLGDERSDSFLKA